VNLPIAGRRRIRREDALRCHAWYDRALKGGVLTPKIVSTSRSAISGGH
jgi:hypothetical protein